jgi:hypothetical protein
MAGERIETGRRHFDPSFHYLIATDKGVRQAEEVHRLALMPTDQMVSHFKAAGLRCVFDQFGLCGRGLFIARPLDNA